MSRLFNTGSQVWVNFPCCLRKMAERPFWRLSAKISRRKRRSTRENRQQDCVQNIIILLRCTFAFNYQRLSSNTRQLFALEQYLRKDKPSYFQIFLLYKWRTKQCFEISFDMILYKSFYNTWTLPFLFANSHYRLSFINYLFLLHSLSEPTDYSLIICEKSIGNCNTVPGSLHLKTFLVISKNANLKF